MAEHDERAVAAEYVQRGHVGFPERVDPARHQEHALHVLGPERQLGRDRIAEIEPVEQQPHVGIVRLKLLERRLNFIDVGRYPVRNRDHVGRRHRLGIADRPRDEAPLARNRLEPPFGREPVERPFHHLLADVVFAHDVADRQETFAGASRESSRFRFSYRKSSFIAFWFIQLLYCVCCYYAV